MPSGVVEMCILGVCSVVEIDVIEKGMLNVVGVGTNSYKEKGCVQGNKIVDLHWMKD